MIDGRNRFSGPPSCGLVASIIIVNYRSGDDLLECLDAIAEHTTWAHEVLVMDNDSSDGSANLIGDRHPSVTVVDMGGNVGYGRAINAGAELACAPYLVVLNPDIVVTERWLEPLIGVLANDSAIGATTPCVVLHDDPETINALGLDIHCTLLGFNRGLHRSVRQMDSAAVRVNGIQGGAFAVRKEAFVHIGGMNPAYFLYHEDVEFSLRVTVAGQHIMAVPTSVVRHKYVLRMTPQKFHWLERHRWLTLVTTFSTVTLLTLSPLLFLTEAMIFAYGLLRGPAYLMAKLRAMSWIAENRGLARRSREQMNAVRLISDMRLVATLGMGYHADQLAVLARQRRTGARAGSRSARSRSLRAGASLRRSTDSQESVR